MQRLYEEGRIYQSKSGAVPRRKMYLDEAKGVPLQDIWTDIVPVQRCCKGKYILSYSKPTALLERILEVATNPGDLVFDCFMGSGTTQAVAMKMGRKFLGADINLGSVQITTKGYLLLHLKWNVMRLLTTILVLKYIM